MTAVEWLYNHLFPKQLDGFSDEEWNKIDLAFKQAKEMEKEQREKDFIQGYKKRAEMSNSIFDETSEEAAKVLFIETLKSE
jgi:hypothetical protein